MLKVLKVLLKSAPDRPVSSTLRLSLPPRCLVPYNLVAWERSLEHQLGGSPLSFAGGLSFWPVLLALPEGQARAACIPPHGLQFAISARLSTVLGHPPFVPASRLPRSSLRILRTALGVVRIVRMCSRTTLTL